MPRAKSPVLSARQLAYLSALRTVYPKGPVAACRASGITYAGTLMHWRKRSEEFALREKEVRQDAERLAIAAAHEARRLEELTPTPKERQYQVDGPLRAFVEVYRTTMDRKTAWEKAGLTWKEVKEHRATNKAFDAEVADVEEEILVQVRDGQAREAITGNTAASNLYLKVSDPENKPSGPKGAPRDRKKGASEALRGVLQFAAKKETA